jgi:hypothetical protein
VAVIGTEVGSAPVDGEGGDMIVDDVVARAASFVALSKEFTFEKAMVRTSVPVE